MCVVSGICPCVCVHECGGVFLNPLCFILLLWFLLAILAQRSHLFLLCAGIIGEPHSCPALWGCWRSALQSSWSLLEHYIHRAISLTWTLDLRLYSAEVHTAAMLGPNLLSSRLTSLAIFLTEIWELGSVALHSFLSHYWTWTLLSIHHWTTLTAFSFSFDTGSTCLSSGQMRL